ncbi:MAG: hypothetical protein ACYDCK_03275 [Thermoplasmatota archaeon]
MASKLAKPLSRKISAEEAENGFILVEKAWLKNLPALRTPFQLKLNGSTLKVQIAAEPCTCRGPDKPHEHYRIHLPLVTLLEGSDATLRAVKPDQFVLEVVEA